MGELGGIFLKANTRKVGKVDENFSARGLATVKKGLLFTI